MRARYAFLALVVLGLPACGYNTLQRQDEGVKAAWSEVVNQYQRRADLIPNLVSTVKGYAAQEQRVLIGVTEARARVGSIQVTPEVLNNPELFQKYQAAQGELTQALKSLLAVTENYPQLKSDQNFRDLHNLTAKMFGFPVKPTFTVVNEQQIATPPAVSFDTSAPGAPAAAPPPPAGSSTTK